MDLSLDILPSILLSAAFSYTVYFLLYRRFIYSVVDPLFLWVLTTAFASVLCIQVIPNVSDIVHFFGCQFFLWIGFMLAYRPYKFLHNFDSSYNISNNLYDQEFLKTFTYILLIFYIISNLIVGFNKGFALLSVAPSEAKIADFQNGFGFFRKLNWSIGTFVSISLIFLYIKNRKKSNIFLFLIVMIFISLEGSKASFLKVMISIGMILYHPIFKNEKTSLFRFSGYLSVLLLPAFLIVYIVLSKENEGLENVLLAFVKRLLYSADSILYYYQPINIDYFKNYTFVDYISRILNPILGFLRIQEYENTPGNIMVDNLRLPGSSDFVTVGPNAPFYIEGKIYFNFWFSLIYSTFIGYTLAKFRTYYFSINKSSSFYFVFVATALQLSDAIIIDTNLAVVQLFNIFIYVYIPYLILSLVLKKRVRLELISRLLKLK